MNGSSSGFGGPEYRTPSQGSVGDISFLPTPHSLGGSKSTLSIGATSHISYESGVW